MFKKDAIKFFGSASAVAKAAGVKPPSVSAWKELIPERRARRLELASGGVLRYDMDLYCKDNSSQH